MGIVLFSGAIDHSAHWPLRLIGAVLMLGAGWFSVIQILRSVTAGKTTSLNLHDGQQGYRSN